MMKVFLVDDEIAIRENLRNSFPWEEKGYQLVGEAPDGEMALPMLRDLNADILLTDIRMPFMDGMKLCEEVQRTMPWVERIILSGYDDFAYAQKAISLGVKEYLLKPVTAAELEAALNRVSRQIEEKRRDRENLTALRERLSSGHGKMLRYFVPRIKLFILSSGGIIHHQDIRLAIDTLQKNRNWLTQSLS